jgi:hypothetical protein
MAKRKCREKSEKMPKYMPNLLPVFQLLIYVLVSKYIKVTLYRNPLRYSAWLLEGDNFKKSHFPMLKPVPPFSPYNKIKILKKF